MDFLQGNGVVRWSAALLAAAPWACSPCKSSIDCVRHVTFHHHGMFGVSQSFLKFMTKGACVGLYMRACYMLGMQQSACAAARRKLCRTGGLAAADSSFLQQQMLHAL